MLQKGGSFKGRIAAREVAMDELWGIIYVFLYINWTSLPLLYERKERVLLYFIVGRIEGSSFLNQDTRKKDIRVFTRVHSSLFAQAKKES